MPRQSMLQKLSQKPFSMRQRRQPATHLRAWPVNWYKRSAIMLRGSSTARWSAPSLSKRRVITHRKRARIMDWIILRVPWMNAEGMKGMCLETCLYTKAALHPVLTGAVVAGAAAAVAAAIFGTRNGNRRGWS